MEQYGLVNCRGKWISNGENITCFLHWSDAYICECWVVTHFCNDVSYAEEGGSVFFGPMQSGSRASLWANSEALIDKREQHTRVPHRIRKNVNLALFHWSVICNALQARKQLSNAHAIVPR